MALCRFWNILRAQVTFLYSLFGSLQPRAPQVLSHPNLPFWPVLIPNPGANWVPRPIIPIRSPHVQLGLVVWQERLPRTQFQITGTVVSVNKLRFSCFVFHSSKSHPCNSVQSDPLCRALVLISEFLYCFAETKLRPGSKNRPVSL